MANCAAMNSTNNNATFIGLEPSGGVKNSEAIMNQKSIPRNDLLLTQDYAETFHDTVLNSEVTIRVEEGDGECCSIRVFDDRIDDCGDCVSFLLDKGDAERFAQAVLLHSGARKVKTGLASVVQFDMALLSEVIDLFKPNELVTIDGDFVVFHDKDSVGYEIPTKDLTSPYWISEWVRHMAEKTWVTKEHLYEFSIAVQSLNRAAP